MIDHIDLPAERELPDEIRAAARERVLTGMREHPGRANRTVVPIGIAAAVVALAAVTVGVGAFGGAGAHVSTGSPGLATAPLRQLAPENTDAAYHVQYGLAPAEAAGRCLAQARREPAGRPAPEQWRIQLAATNHDDTVIAYRTPAGPVFCEATPTTVALSSPGAPATATARPTFLTSFGTVAGTIDPNYRAAWLGRHIVGDTANLDEFTSAVVDDGIFLLPDAIPVPTDGLELGVSPTPGMAEMQTLRLAQDQLPPVIHPATDNASLPAVDQHDAAGQRMIACLHGPNAIPVVAPQAWLPGAYLTLDGHDTVQLASLGGDHDLLVICTNEANEPPYAQIVDQNGYFGTDTVEPNQLITANTVFYDFRPAQGGSSSDKAAIAGQLISPKIASVRMTWPGGPNLTATVHNGTYLLPGYDLNDPTLHGGQPTITVYDARGAALRSFPLNPTAR